MANDGNSKESDDASEFNKCLAFMHWLNSEDKTSLSCDDPMVLLKFVNDKHTMLIYMQRQMFK